MKFFQELKRRNVFRVGVAYSVAAWVFLQVLDLVIEYIAAPVWIMHLVLMLLAAGLPAIMLGAWLFEITPEGVKRERDVDRSQSITRETGRKLDRLVIVFLTIAVVFLLADRFTFTDMGQTAQPKDEPEASTAVEEPKGGEAKSETAEKSIAVLPLANRSTNPEDAFFAEGMHDELLTQLSRISALTVISRTSVMGYAGTTKRMTEIGQELGVAHLVEGGVQRAGNRVRINVQLIEAANDKHLWAEVYDRELTADNLFDIQSDITRSIASALQTVLTGEEERNLAEKPTENVDAYAFYLRAKAAAATYGRTGPQIDRSIAAYRKAVELDPGFADAWAALSTDYSERYWTGNQMESLEAARDALDRAQSMAPASADTAIAEGYFHYWGYLEYDQAIKAFDRALAAKPGSMLALRGKAYVLRRMGRLDEALDMFNQIVSRDPLNADIPVDQAYVMYSTGDMKGARERLEQARALGVSSSFLATVEALLLSGQGRFEEALRALGAPRSDTPVYIAAAQINLAHYAGDTKRLEALEQFVRERLQEEDAPIVYREMLTGILYAQGADDELQPLLAQLEPEFREQRAIGQDSSDNIGPAVSLINIYALQNDEASLREAVRYFDEELKPDFMRPMESGASIPTAFALVGDIDTAMDRAEAIIERFGIWAFWPYHFEPAFEPFRDHPRYRALDDRYLAWLEEQNR